VLSQTGVSAVRLSQLLGTVLVATAAARAHYDRKVRGYQLNKTMWEVVKSARPAGLGKWGDDIALICQWAERWTRPRLRAALKATLDADRSAKSTTVTDDTGIVRELVLRVGAK
jgi:DNA polymerase III delta subunit